jgi:hypothetical protein
MLSWLAKQGKFKRPDAGLYQLQRVLLDLQREGKVRCCTDHAQCTLETLSECAWIKPLALSVRTQASIRSWARQEMLA